jgi:Na+/H+ antiporter NhaD/arsenite permease-like protein
LIAQKIKTQNIVYFVLIISLLSFFISAIIDNLTTAIVMVSLVRKILKNQKTLLLIASLIVIASNAGGAWSPLGDVTTTMLWIKGQISAIGIIKSVFIPSVVSLAIPMFWILFKVKQNPFEFEENNLQSKTTPFERNSMLIAGLSVFIFVPIFKNLTHLPPYMGMLLGLGILWLISEMLHHQKDTDEREQFSASYALSRIDSSSILFFLGILLAVSALETSQVLNKTASLVNHQISSPLIIATLFGLISAVLDNVPLVAATISMFSLTDFPLDNPFWLLLAYAAGTGGSILIIGSAAGVAVMGMVKIEFMWYLKNISLPTLIGYLMGIFIFILLN